MCNYKYTVSYEHMHRLMGKECPYTKIYRELKKDGIYKFENITSNLELPLDTHGICIFHSNELEWKRKNNFAIKFLELLQSLEIYSSFEFQVSKLFRFVTSDDLTSEQKIEFLTAFNRLPGSAITLEILDKDNLEVAIHKQCASQSVAELDKLLAKLYKELKGNHPLKTYKSLYDYSRRYYDLVEFVFVGEYPKLSKDGKDYIFTLTYLTLNKEANFTGALFVDHVEFDLIKFNDGATFQQARFSGELKMKNICLGGADFTKTIFEQTVSFENVDFLSYALFPDSQFTYSSYADGYSFIFNNSRFHGVTDFSRVTVKSKDSNSSVAFQNVNFKDAVDFTDSIFDCTVSFRNVEFDAIVEFINTSFNTTKSTSRHREYAVEFVEIAVNEKGSLIFQSTDPQSKMFKQDVRFSFKKEIEGTLKFENANFNNIDDVSRRKLLLLSKLGKIEIGSGCIKYRFQTKIRTSLINGNNQPLILELTQTFVNYFTAKNGFNLGFEIVERDNAKISFFYFTDENITENEFLDRLQETEQGLWNLISTRLDKQSLLTDDKVGKNLSKENAIINAVDGISALMGTFFRVGIRIAYGEWFQKDTKALLNAVDFDNQTLLDAANLHQVLLDKYTATDLFLIRDRQNSNLLLSPVNVFLDQSQHISTDGGTFVQGNVNTGGDFIGRDQAKEGSTKPTLQLKLSIAHPVLLSKGFTSPFLVQFYLPRYKKNAMENVTRSFAEQQPVIREYKSEAPIGKKIKIRLHCPEMTFAEPVVRDLTKNITTVSFWCKPNDNCIIGVHYATLSITNPESNEEYQSFNFPVRIVDYVFDHVSRPFLSNVLSVAMGIGSLTLFILTVLGRIDSTLGIASGTTAGVVASGVYIQMFAHFKRSGIKIP